VRLLTLTGVGGVGKTRLALQVAADLAADFPAGVVWVELAPLADGALVPSAVTAAAGVTAGRGRSPEDVLVVAWQERAPLLVLDNCEHLVAACASFAERLLSACPNLRVLATSREPLQIAGERQWHVPPLSVPPLAPDAEDSIAASPRPGPEGTPSASGMSETEGYGAVQLFVERARAVTPAFELTERNAAVVARICASLDGLPLAIELAAALVGVLPTEQILERLDDRFRVLSRGSRTAPARQQTLRAALDWGHDLLSEPERRLFRRLTAFAGGFTLEAAEVVCAGTDVGFPESVQLTPDDVLELLRQLVDKSLVVVDLRPDGARYRLLETLRAYARGKARAAGEVLALERRHREWFLALAESTRPDWLDAGQIRGLAREQHNLRAALRWSIQAGEGELALRLAASLHPLWYVHGGYAEGRAWLAEVLALPGAVAPTPARARALAFAGQFASLQGSEAEAETLLDEGLAAARRAGDLMAQALCHQFLGHVARRRGALAEAEALYRRALELARQTGNLGSAAWDGFLIALTRFEIGDPDGVRRALGEIEELGAADADPRVRAGVLALEAWLAALAGNQRLALACEDQSLDLARSIGDQQSLAFVVVRAVWNALGRDDRPAAARHLATALSIARETGDQFVLVKGLEGVAELVATADPRPAARLMGAAATLRRSAGLAPTPLECSRLERWRAGVTRRLGEEGFVAAWHDGEQDSSKVALTTAFALAEVVERGLSRKGEIASAGERPLEPPGLALTRREREVAELIAAGNHSDREIAAKLTISPTTAGLHVQRLLAKLGLHSRWEVAAWVNGSATPGSSER
jgi:non-specific serine/threonine protein kinase